ncbi:hypothetical protein D0Z08_10140 [Nocardioides immobilis]|uniref:Alpha/beta hydrolase n=1 Tax=Nocardioides immobilis TaxID=2049295 RepID=A0A417Y2Y9_9ACTN|nr:hypothetical protein [Nocardioides immobilis]RHW27030.1 hypothetical protein D0Z08_10140 [Nocardioides immobilis]
MVRETVIAELASSFENFLSARDRELMSDERLSTAFATSMQEALRQGATGAEWDNVAWVGPWEVDPASLNCPVLLWYGNEDLFVPPGTAEWLRDHIPDAQLVLRCGEGHLGFMEHAAEKLHALTEPTS